MAAPLISRRTRWLPFAFLHLGALSAFFVGCSWTAVSVAIGLYWLRMFAITAFYHRYFSHRTYKTSRPAQFVFALLGLMAVQRGPLWWAAHHRVHHRLADLEGDAHSPVVSGFLWSHIGWITADRNMPTNYLNVRDLARYPELIILNRFDWLMPFLLGLSLYLSGCALDVYCPAAHTTGNQMLAWGFFLSSCVLFHCVSSINSVAHVWGKPRYPTRDASKNNFLLALVTLGEGWHNNHHFAMNSVRQGFYWWEIDVCFYILKLMSWLGIIWDLRPVPVEAYDPERQLKRPERQLK
ncbi:MAG: acyl-CoA desaturase [Cyanobacteria bacterium REEB67]|nr:acyl-CoA desaturase [Cyanobacteria bacterium REEB67]